MKNEILEHGVFVNKENTNDYFSNMNKAYENLQKIYEESYDYLLGTYYAVTNPEHHSADYITNFEVLFKDALKELNAFYYNAGMAYSYGLKNTFETNNYYKLKIQYYTLLVNGHISDYLMDLSFDMPYEGEISSIKSQIEAISVNVYLNNKDSYDTLIAESKIVDLETLTQKVVEGNEQTYLSSIIDEDEKEITQNYYNLVVKG